MEGLVTDKEFWRGKRVFLTGHTGFKGSYASLWLSEWGADITGYALAPNTQPSLFDLARVHERVKSVIGDIRGREGLKKAMLEARPEIIIHMAAQPLVRESYINPVETYETNVMGTVNLLDAARHCEGLRAVVAVTTDKCYENKEWVWGYREDEPMGGRDPYSSSKGCCELVINAYRSSFFPPERYGEHGVAVASARAGNVIGGGDWAKDRLIPDFLSAMERGEEVRIRSPRAIRPWQYVLEPLSGYFALARALYERGHEFSGGWNFGPEDADAREVEWIVRRMCALWGGGAGYAIDKNPQPHEASYLKLDISKAKALLKWYPKWNLARALEVLTDWHKRYLQGEDVRALCLETIERYNDPNL